MWGEAKNTGVRQEIPMHVSNCGAIACIDAAPRPRAGWQGAGLDGGGRAHALGTQIVCQRAHAVGELGAVDLQPLRLRVALVDLWAFVWAWVSEKSFCGRRAVLY